MNLEDSFCVEKVKSTSDVNPKSHKFVDHENKKRQNPQA